MEFPPPPQCAHGHICTLAPLPELGPGWVQPTPSGCQRCIDTPDVWPIRYKPGTDADTLAPVLTPRVAATVAQRNPDNWMRVGLPEEEPARAAKIEEFSKLLGGPPSEVTEDAALWRTGAKNGTAP